MSLGKDILDLINRLGLGSEEILYGKPDELIFRGESLHIFIYRLNRIMDRLDCTDAQATRWRIQRDEALAQVEALEKQNGDLAASYLEALFGEKRDFVNVPDGSVVHLPVVCQHPRSIGTTSGWKCVDCGQMFGQNEGLPIHIDPLWNF